MPTESEMRLKKFCPLAGGPDIQLHPRITLLIGLRPLEQVELVASAHSLALGEEPVWEGLLEVSGVEMTLSEAAKVIGRTAEAAPVATAEEFLDDWRRGRSAVIDRVASPAVLEKTREQLAAIAEELTGAEKLRAEMNARVTSARANVDDEAFAKLDRAMGNLRRAADRSGRPDPWTGMSNVEGRLTELKCSIGEFDELLDELPRGDRVKLAGAVAEVRAALSENETQQPEAARLAEAWRVLDEHRRGVEERFVADGLDLDGALARLESTRAAFCVAEEAAIPRAITGREAAAVERAHERFHTLHEKTSAGMRRGASRERTENARNELSAILASLGYASWSELRMGNGAVRLPEELLRDYEMAKAETNAAEIEWAEITATQKNDREIREIGETIVAINEEATRLLGSDPLGLVDGRQLREAIAEFKTDAGASCDPALAAAGLRAALSVCGSAGHRDISSPRGVLALGESWLSVLRDSDAARRRLLHDRGCAASELEVLSALGEGSRVDRLDVHRAAVDEAAAGVEISRSALFAIARARMELHVLAATELALAEDHDSRVELIEQSQHESLSPESIGEQWVVRGPGGALPIVILAGSVEPTQLDPLLALPDDVQVIVVADGEAVQRWAHSVGAEHAGVVDCRVLV